MADFPLSMGSVVTTWTRSPKGFISRQLTPGHKNKCKYHFPEGFFLKKIRQGEH